MKKPVLIAFALAAVGLCRPLGAVEIENASSGAIVPGEWNTNFSAAKAYAEQNKIPMLLVWSSPGCAQCNKLKTACNTDTFVAWRKAKQIVLVISEGDGTSKAFAKNSSGKFPYVRLYWPAGGLADVRFSARSSLAPLSGVSGATLETKFINYLNSLLKNWAPGGSSPGIDEQEEDDTPGPEWNKSRKLFGSLVDPDGRIAGRLLVSAGKMNAKKGVSKVKVQVQDLNGRTKTLGSKDFTVKGTTTVKLSGNLGSANITIKGSTLSGTVYFNGMTCTVSSRAPGGSIADGTLYFNLEDGPVACQGYPVINGTDYLPAPQAFTSAGSKWSFPRRGTLKYDAKKAAFVMSPEENPSGLKLSYAPSTGYFKGSFTVYAKRGEKTIKKYKATVGGFMIGGEGDGAVTIKNVGYYGCTISPKFIVR